MLPRCFNLWVLAVVLFGAVDLRPASAESGREPAPVPLEPEVKVGSEAFFVASVDPRISCRASVAPGRQELFLSYSHSETGRLATVFESQAYDLNYEPTTVAHVGDNQILVAGKRANGATAIEWWLLKPPTLVSTSDPLKIELDPRLERKVLLDGHAAGRSVVQAMFVALGTAADRQAFVLFHDSRDLYSLNFRTNQLALVASPQLVEGAMHVTELSADLWRFVIAGEHIERGYIYRFSAGECIPTGPNLHLSDSDRDGRIDDHEMIGEREWFARDYSNSSTWVRHVKLVP